nr:MAG TPA: hypothetical protein [Caudoviricetes sp.]
MGYRKVSAAEQVFYILKYKAHELRLRFRLWKKLKKHCRHCCLWCKYFKPCRSDVEADNDK